MRTKNNSLILKTTLWVLANQISFFKNILMNDNTKTRFIRRSKYNTKKYSRISEPERSSRKKSIWYKLSTDCGRIVDSSVRDSGWIRQIFEFEKRTLIERFVGFLYLNIHHAIFSSNFQRIMHTPLPVGSQYYDLNDATKPLY